MAFTFRPFRATFFLLAIAAIVSSAIPSAHAKAEVRKGNEARARKIAAEERKIEDRIRKGVAVFLGVPESVVESVSRIPQGGLYEVVLTNGELFYTDKAVSFFILGNIIDAETRQNLTGERLDKLSRIDFKSLPLEQAVKRINGNGKRVIVTFEDPNCSYCKHLGKELQKVKNVTLYTFLYPMLSDDSISKSRHIWCAENKAAAWTNWIVGGKAPEARDCDSAVIDRNLELGKKLRVTGTPVLFFSDGSRIVGYRAAEDLEQILVGISVEESR
ncbi:MAG: DsbC family protein [Proteobacteria bacterium]|jgi:thiol:disulfide interchange protein DsbC|nr:DsbC family protein [Pseudomonadota bacterium]